MEFYDLDQVIAYACMLENATTIAKVGFFLEQHRDLLMVEKAHLNALRKLRPKHTHYLVRGRPSGGHWVKD